MQLTKLFLFVRVKFHKLILYDPYQNAAHKMDSNEFQNRSFYFQFQLIVSLGLLQDDSITIE